VLSQSHAVPATAIGASGGSVAPKRDRRRYLTKVDRRSRLGLRIKELTRLFTEATGGSPTPLRKLKIARAAELTALAEKARGDFMRDGLATLSDIAAIERKADLAVRALGLADDPPAPLESPAPRGAKRSRAASAAQPKPGSLAEHFAKPPSASS
jgi:hypothetical protein